ncbi:hypothetical protein M1P56_14225 [Streptomyces sp. HU2014]|uniref:Uncharacterized protein n=1 Tax=Streptomyces albireticuli TaxID=1940 RepID=A0A1Z2LCV2_9ACTN|nr:hypothetical protein [Streptomyces sp. HU2014]ARZ72031.1 hypothetical protein SMD11_6455 [Streptomyces albireticuli]UQI45422.1 hypothetical protein M1P56_14225 [Streptomyces sp. HU2014]
MANHAVPAVGRLWTVHLTTDRDPDRRTMTLRCSVPGCRPDPVPLPTPAAARTAAAGHLAGHGHAAGPPPPGTGCRCGKEGCAWHAWTVPGCRGEATGQVILHTDTGRLWRLAEVCEHCAASIPDARVLRPLNTRPPARAHLRGGCWAGWSSVGAHRPQAG